MNNQSISLSFTSPFGGFDYSGNKFNFPSGVEGCAATATPLLFFYQMKHGIKLFTYDTQNGSGLSTNKNA